MIVQAEMSLYPLRTSDLSEAIDRFLDGLKDPHLKVTTSPMSTHVVGELETTFHAISRAFADVSNHWQVVLILKVSNACPEQSAVEIRHTDG